MNIYEFIIDKYDEFITYFLGGAWAGAKAPHAPNSRNTPVLAKI